MQVLTLGHLASAASALTFSGTLRPPRRPSSAVMTQFDFAVLDAVDQAVGREAAEHDRVDGADAGAGEDRHGCLGYHRQIDGDAIALLDALGLQHVGEAAGVLVQLGVADMLVLGRAVALPQDRRLVRAGGEMAVEAVVGGVERAIVEPADMDLAGEVDVLDLGRLLGPGDAFGLLPPETLGVVDRQLVKLEIAGLVEPGGLGGGFGHGEQVGGAHAGRRPFARKLVNAVLIDRLLPQSYGLTSAYSRLPGHRGESLSEINRITVLRAGPFISC